MLDHVRSIVKSFGCRLPSYSTRSFATKARPALPESLRPALEPVLDSIQEISEHIQKHDREIERLGQETYPETVNMRQIKVVGALTALAYVLTLEDADRFSTSREVGPYVGLVPRRNQSGDADLQGRITKTGDKYLHRLLAGWAKHILGLFWEKSHLRTWGLRMAKSSGKKAKNRAVVAVAQKLVVQD